MALSDYLVDIAGIVVGAVANISLHIICNQYKKTFFKLEMAAITELTPELFKEIKMNPEGFTALVHGTVWHSNSNAIHSEAQPEITGVIHKKQILQHIVTKIFGAWVNDVRTVISNTQYIPFLLYNQGMEVQILNPDKLQGFDLTVVNDVFKPEKNSVLEHIVGWMKNIQIVGIQEIEEMLIEGTEVTGVGRIISKKGVLHLIPEDNLPYIVSTKDISKIMEEAEAYFTVFRILKYVSFFGTAYMIYRFVSHYLKDRKRKKEIRDMVNSYNKKLNSASLQQSTPSRLECVVCLNQRSVAIIPCGHVCVCTSCALKLSPPICPICREAISTIMPLFYS